MATRGLLIGSPLTAIPFFVFHIPLAFAQPGLNTTWEQAALNLGLTALIAPVLSIPARNSAHRFGRQYPRDRPTACIIQRLRTDERRSRRVAVRTPPIALTLAVIVCRRLHGCSFTQGFAPALVATGTPISNTDEPVT